MSDSPPKSRRAYRGSGWLNDPRYARVAHRRHFTPNYLNLNLGIRLVEEVTDV